MGADELIAQRITREKQTVQNNLFQASCLINLLLKSISTQAKYTSCQHRRHFVKFYIARSTKQLKLVQTKVKKEVVGEKPKRNKLFCSSCYKSQLAF